MLTVKAARRGMVRLIGRERMIRLRLFRTSISPRARRALRQADALLVSYPKCGRTWLGMLLARSLGAHAGLAEDEIEYLATDMRWEGTGLPHVRLTHDDDPHWKTPARVQRSKRRYRNKKVVLLVRDPRDVVVSMYFERSRRERVYSGSLSEFLREPRGSLETILAYYDVWAQEHERIREFLLVRYEDLKADTAGELERILRFLGVEPLVQGHVQEAVRFSSFENMRAMETDKRLGSGRLRPRDPGDVQSYKTRRGKVGGYVDDLEPADVAWMEERIRSSRASTFGYLEPAGRGAAAFVLPAFGAESRGRVC